MPTSIEPLSPFEANSADVPFAVALPMPLEDVVEIDDNAPSPSAPSAPSSRMCILAAPSTLSAGYTFTAQVDGIDFVVTIPEGGVTEGQQFQVPYPTRSAAAVPVPPVSQPQHTHPPQPTPTATDQPAPAGGYWRDDLCDCFGVFCNCMFWNAWLCTPVLYGQLMQRLHLNPCGIPSSSPNNNESCYTKHTCVILVWIWVIFLILEFALVGVEASRYVWYVFAPFFWIVFMNTRYHYRRRYNIHVSSFECCDGRCNDFLCGVFCHCCVAIQLARHTHDHHDYPYQCCSTTGLSANAPSIVIV